MKTKICTKCNKRKSIIKFYKHSRYKDGVYSWCKNCCKLYNQDFYLKNKEQIKGQSQNYRKKYPTYFKNYYLKNKMKIIKSNINYTKQRLKNDIKFRVVHNLRHRITDFLKGNSKSLKSMFLIGCEIDYLIYHIQRQFSKGMNWDNYGEWHIDHIKPCAKFDLSDPEQQLICFNYTNLQPLWAIDNLRKRKS